MDNNQSKSHINTRNNNFEEKNIKISPNEYQDKSHIKVGEDLFSSFTVSKSTHRYKWVQEKVMHSQSYLSKSTEGLFYIKLLYFKVVEIIVFKKMSSE